MARTLRRHSYRAPVAQRTKIDLVSHPLRWSVAVATLLLFAIATPLARPDTIVVSNRDNTIFNLGNPNYSLGGGVSFYAGTNNSNQVRRALIGFDLSAIPAGSRINTVSLSLVLAGFSGGGSGGGSGNPQIGLHKLLQQWGEGTSGWMQGPGQTGQGYATVSGETPSTWNHAFYGVTPWSSTGGDFVGSASATTSVGTASATYTWGSTAGMVADVQEWLDNPLSNFGWLLKGDESTSGTFRQFYSREYGVSGSRPMLTIHYSLVPEPGTGVLAIGGALAGVLAWGFRRRRAVA